TTHHFYHADGVGNITAMVDSSQMISASYRYDPFGSLISSSGAMSSVNMYRYSSKEWLFYANLYYYGYRFYDPNLQRWLNRDPIGESGFEAIRREATTRYKSLSHEVAVLSGDGMNQYRFCRNDAILHYEK